MTNLYKSECYNIITDNHRLQIYGLMNGIEKGKSSFRIYLCCLLCHRLMKRSMYKKHKCTFRRNHH